MKFWQKRRADANVGELISHLTNLVHVWAYAPPAVLPRVNDSFDPQQERSMATQTAGWLAKETSKLSMHAVPVPGGSAPSAQGVSRVFAVPGTDAAKRDEFSQTAVGAGACQPESGRASASAFAATDVAPVVMSRRAMKRQEREQRRMVAGVAPCLYTTAAATPAPAAAAALVAESFVADAPVVVEAAVVVGPQHWQQQHAEQLHQQKTSSRQMPPFHEQFQQQQQQTPERDQAAGNLARFFKTAGHQQLQQRQWGQDASSSAPVSALRPSVAAAAPAHTAPTAGALAPPAYTRMQPPPVPLPLDTQDPWGAGSGVWGSLADLGGASSAGSANGKGGMMFVGDKQVESRSPASDAPWMGFGSAAGGLFVFKCMSLARCCVMLFHQGLTESSAISQLLLSELRLHRAARLMEKLTMHALQTSTAWADFR